MSTLTPPEETGLRAVVAEDETLIRLDLVEVLTGAGYRVVAEAGDGRAAVEAVREHRPDIVVMDVKMPVMDGIAAAGEIAAAPSSRKVSCGRQNDSGVRTPAAAATVLATGLSKAIRQASGVAPT